MYALEGHDNVTVNHTTQNEMLKTVKKRSYHHRRN